MTSWRAGLVGGVLLLSACGDEKPSVAPATELAGGETSEFGGDIPACPCGFLRSPLRGTVVIVADGTVRVRVDELFGAIPGVEVGSELEGLWDGRLPCNVGRAAVGAGDEILGFYWPAEGDTIAARLALTAWGDSVVLADATRDLIVSVADLPMLDAPDAQCRAALGNISDYLGPDDSTP